MNLPRGICCLLALVITGCQAGERSINLNGNDNGCNGVPHGIPCCEEGGAHGDNAGDEEMFIQADEYISSCIHSCKSLYPNSVGITESRRQQYSSGPGRNKNKCWCEFGRGKLDFNNQGYTTCMFKERSKSEVSSPSNVSAKDEAGAPPKYLMVVTNCEAVPSGTKHRYYKDALVMLTKCEADQVQGQKMGRYTLQLESYNNFSVWKKEHLDPEQYLFMSDNHHWVIGPDVTANLFGVLSEDRPTPVFPHLAKAWRFWDGQDWKEGNITVMAGEKKDVGEDREMIMLDFKTIEVDNVNDSSHCCRACKQQPVVTDKALMSPMTVMFNFAKEKKKCGCFNTPSYGFNFHVETIALTRYNSQITSGLCDTGIKGEHNRRAGTEERHPTYHYNDVQGPLGEGTTFETDLWVGIVILDQTEPPVHPSSCCKECRKKHNDTDMFTYIGTLYDPDTKANVPNELFVDCWCHKVKSGTRPVTRRFSPEYYTGICEDIGAPVDCEVEPRGWSHWTECSNLRKTCGRGFRSRYARNYQVARRGGKPCEELEQAQSCEVEHCPPA